MDCQTNQIPPELIQDGIPFRKPQEKADLFAQVFKAKVQGITENTVLNPNIENGQALAISQNLNFFTTEAVLKTLQELKKQKKLQIQQHHSCSTKRWS